MSSDRHILAIGANPAWEKVLHFGVLRPGEVNRAGRCGGYPAGKAGNFCRALQRLGGTPGRQLTFLGGLNGQRYLDACRQEGLECVAIDVPEETRCCINCVQEDGTMTELVEPGAPISPRAAADFRNQLVCEIPAAAALAICGSIPKGTEEDFMEQIALYAGQAGLPLLVDNVDFCRRLRGNGDRIVVKINADEVRKCTGEADVPSALRLLHEQFPRLSCGITDGPGCAWLLDPFGGSIVRFELPRLESIVNPLGAGDTCSAVFISRLLDGFNAAEAFADALCAASASCLTDICGDFSTQKALELRMKTRWSDFLRFS